MANWMKKYFSNNGDDDDQSTDGCRLSTYSSRKCSYQNGEMKCRNEKRVVRNCPGKEPQVVESTVEDTNGAPEDGPKFQEEIVFPNVHSIFDSMFQMMNHPFVDMNRPPSQYPQSPLFPFPFEEEGPRRRPQQTEEQEDPFFLRQKRKQENQSAPPSSSSRNFFDHSHSDRI